jgi:hypothetical protein
VLDVDAPLAVGSMRSTSTGLVGVLAPVRVTVRKRAATGKLPDSTFAQG